VQLQDRVTALNASGNFQAGTSIITWTVTDIHGNTSTGSTTVVVNTLPVVVIPDVNVLPAGTLPNTVYLGYAPASTITLVAGSATTNLQYAWSNGGAGASITVSPVAGTLYSVTVTDANGCNHLSRNSYR
jgi:hypothetical protein